MAGGMEIMLKSFGLDPEKIKAEFGSLGAAVREVEATMKRIEAKLDLVLAERKQSDSIIDTGTVGTTTGGN